MRRNQLILLSGLILAGCSDVHYRPMTYTNVDDMRPGPGLFTGKEGAFVLFHSDKPLDLGRDADIQSNSGATPEPASDQ